MANDSTKDHVVELSDHEGAMEQSWVYGPYTERQANARLKRLLVALRKANREWGMEYGEKYLPDYPMTARTVRLQTLEEAQVFEEFATPAAVGPSNATDAGSDDDVPKDGLNAADEALAPDAGNV